MRLTKFNPETGQYEYIENAKTQEEFKAQRKAVIQKLGEYEDKASDVAEEIFAEIETIKSQKDFISRSQDFEFGYAIALADIAELKKKYTQDKGRDKIAEFGKYSPLSWRNTED